MREMRVAHNTIMNSLFVITDGKGQYVYVGSVMRSSFPTVSFICNVGSKVMAENENGAKERKAEKEGEVEGNLYVRMI